MAAEIKVGDKAPDFTLEDQDKNAVTLSSFQGKKNVVLAFYPLDWSPVCTNENTCFSNDLPKFDHANAVVFGISTDSVWSIRRNGILAGSITSCHTRISSSRPSTGNSFLFSSFTGDDCQGSST